MNRGALFALLITLVGAPGCAVTDTGNPPLTPPDTGLMSSMFLGAGQLTITGAAGAIVEPGGVLRLTDLSNAAEPVDAPVQADGSFSVTLFAETGAVLRLQHVAGPDRSTPIDVLSEPLAPAPTPLPCLTLDPPLELRAGTVDAATERTVSVQNDCDAAVTLGARTRREAPDLAVTPALDATELAPGEQTTLRLAIAPSGEAEAVVLLETTTPEAATRALTVYTTAP